jgi:hypothetical protein
MFYFVTTIDTTLLKKKLDEEVTADFTLMVSVAPGPAHQEQASIEPY